MEGSKPLLDGDTTITSELPLTPPSSEIETPSFVTDTNGVNLQDNLETSLSTSLNFDNNNLNFNMSVNEEEWYPKLYCSSICQHKMFHNKKAMNLQKLQDIIQILILDPGAFDDVSGAVIKILTPHFEIPEDIVDIVNVIFQQAIIHSNFQYNAARLCAYIQEYCPMFRKTLDKVCKNQVSASSMSHKHDFALFFAELYVQFNFDKFYSNLVMYCLEYMIMFVDGANIKSLCHVLKLTGLALEVHHSKAVDHLFEQLDCLLKMPRVPYINLINSVIELRNSMWGLDQCYDFCSPQNLDCGSVIFSSDGKEMTEEEFQFLKYDCSLYIDCLKEMESYCYPSSNYDSDPELDFIIWDDENFFGSDDNDDLGNVDWNDVRYDSRGVNPLAFYSTAWSDSD